MNPLSRFLPYTVYRNQLQMNCRLVEGKLTNLEDNVRKYPRELCTGKDFFNK